jgi:uncharacterized protein (DUF1330 family)
MPAYVIATMTIADPDMYRQYTDRTPPTVKRHGGRFLTRGDEVFTAEGEPMRERQVILEFPSAAAAKTWFDDPDYQAARAFRLKACSSYRMLIQEGRPNTADPDPKV